jgi:hypothetical protein
MFKVLRYLADEERIEVSKRRREAMIALAPCSAVLHAGRALDLIEGIETRWARLDALLALAPRLPDELSSGQQRWSATSAKRA